MKEVFGLGRNRSSEGKGEWTSIHLNPYVNCVHTLVGGVEDDGGFSSGGL